MSDASFRAKAAITPEAKGAFLANLDHEIRTPLHGVIAGADMLAKSNPPEDLRELIELVRSSSQVLEARLETLLRLIQREQGFQARFQHLT